MNPFARLGEYLTGKLANQIAMKAANFPQPTPWAIWSPSGSRVDYATQASPMDSSILMACLNWITLNFPEAPAMMWRVERDGTRQPAPDHPLVTLLSMPNPYYSGAELWMGTLLSWWMDGNAYWQIVRSRAEAPVELWYVPHYYLKPAWPTGRSDVFISHYEKTINGQVERIPVEDIVHFRRGIDPANNRKGLSPIKSLMQEFWTDQAAADFTSTLMRNMGVPGLVISPDGDVAVTPSPDERREIKATFQQQTTGDHRGEPIVLTGATKVQEFGFDPQRMNTRELRQIPEERVTAVLGIPAAVVGFGTGLEQTKVGATMKELRELAYENNIIPSQRIFSTDITRQLLPQVELSPAGWEFGFDLSGVRVLQEDENAKAERAVKLVAGSIWTRAEAREATGKDFEETDKVYHMGVSIIEVPQGQPGPGMDSPPDDDAGSDADNQPPDGSAGAEWWLWPKDGEETKASRLDRALMSQFRRDARRLESVFTRSLNQAFQQLGDLAYEAASDLLVKSASLVTAGTNGHGLKQGDPTPDDIVTAERIMAAIDFTAYREDVLRPTFEGHYLRVARATVEGVNSVMTLGVNLPDQVERRIVDIGGKRMGLVDIEEATKRALFHSLSQGRAAGDGPFALARRIRADVPAGRFSNAGSGYRAKIIARTETKYAQNVSSLQTYRAIEVFDGVQAFDNQTGFGDADCTARDGQVFDFDQADRETEREHPNGTLSWAPHVRGR